MEKYVEFTIDLRYYERKDAKEGYLPMKQPTIFFFFTTAQKFVIKVYGIGLVQ